MEGIILAGGVGLDPQSLNQSSKQAINSSV